MDGRIIAILEYNGLHIRNGHMKNNQRSAKTFISR